MLQRSSPTLKLPSPSYEQGAFDSEAARKGYEFIKERDNPRTAQAMASSWVTK